MAKARSLPDTTIMDPEDATAAELAAAYQERWESNRA